MKKIFKNLITSFILTILIFSCQKQEKSNTFETMNTSDKKMKISVSIPPLKWITEKIAGSDFIVTSVVKPNVSPELFDPSVKTVEELEKADIYFTFDLFTFEHKLEDAVSKTEKIYNILEIDDHFLLKENDKHMEEGHNHGTYDPHVWLSLEIDPSIAENIKNALSEKYPEKKDIFKKNYDNFISETNTFKEELKTLLNSKKSKVFVIYHPALTYFAKEYNLTQIFVEQEGKEPTAQYLQTVINEIKKNNVKVLLVQPQFPKSSVELISREVPDVKIIEFNPIEENIFENLRNFTDSLE